MHSTYDNTNVLTSIQPAVYTASSNGAAIDTMGYQSLEVAILAGVIDLASGNETYNFKVQESIDSAFTTPVDLTTPQSTGAITANNTVLELRVDGLGEGPRLRYMRVVLTAAGTTPSIAMSASMNLGRAYQNPVN